MNESEDKLLAAARKAILIRKARAGDLVSFARYVFGVEPAPHHRLWLSALQSVHDGDIRRLLLIAPPGHAKSTYASIIFPTFEIGFRYNEPLIGISTTDPLAELYGDTVRTTIEESPEFRNVFPDVVPDTRRGWTKQSFFVKGKQRRARRAKDPSYVSVGAGGAIIGRRAAGLVIDDAVDEPTARSETLLEARKLWIKRSALSRLVPGSFVVVAGTLWADGDVVATFKADPEFTTIQMRALSSTQSVEADVWIADGVAWRPDRYVEVEGESDED